MEASVTTADVAEVPAAGAAAPLQAEEASAASPGAAAAAEEEAGPVDHGGDEVRRWSPGSGGGGTGKEGRIWKIFPP